jgi:preprotein translocase subunit SecE
MTTNTVSTKEKLSTYFRGVKAELKKVIWPNKKELINYTGVVILLSAVVALVVYVLDLGIHGVLSLIIK